MRLLQYEDGASFNARTVIHDLHCKFNQHMRIDYRWSLGREETFKGKLRDRAKLDFLLEWLKDQVSMARTFYHANPKNPKLAFGIAMKFGESRGKLNYRGSKGNRGGSQQQQQQKSEPKETTTVLATDTRAAATSNTNRGGGAARGDHGRDRGRGGARCDRGRGGSRGRGRGRGSTPATSTSNNDQPASASGTDNNDRKVIHCCFCNNPRHSSHNCTQQMKPDTVYIKALEF